MIVTIQIIEQKQNYLPATTVLMVAMTTSDLQNRQDTGCSKVVNQTLLLLRHFSLLGLLNVWYNCTSSTQRSPWNSVRRLKNDLHTLYFASKILLCWSEITYGLEPFNISIVFGWIRKKLNFVVFWKNIAEYHRSPEKTHDGLVQTRTNEVSPKIQYLSKICSIFTVINQSDIPDWRKKLIT